MNKQQRKIIYSFKIVEQVAQKKGCKLERGGKHRPFGQKTGYILWNKGLWVQWPTLTHVMRQLNKLPDKEESNVR